MLNSKPISGSLAALIVLAALFLLGSSTISNVRSFGQSTLFGDWAGDSICQVKNSACHDEKVVYHISKGREPSLVEINADKIVNGKTINMGSLEFNYDRETNTLTSDAHGHWKFIIKVNKMDGTLTMPDNTLYRVITLTRKMD